MSPDNEDGIDIIFTRPRKEGGSLVLTIPKHVCDKLRITKGSRLHLILYNSFMVLKHREKVDYDEESLPRTLELLDRMFELFREEKNLKRKRYFEKALDLTTYDSRMKEIHKILKETSSKILILLKEKKWEPELPTFLDEFQSAEEVLGALHDFYNECYKEVGL